MSNNGNNNNANANRQYAANLMQQQRAAMQQATNGSEAAGSPAASGSTPQAGTPEPALVTKVSQAIALLKNANPAAGDAFLNRVKTIPQNQILHALTEALVNNGLGYAAAALMPNRNANPGATSGQGQARPPVGAPAAAGATGAGGTAMQASGSQPGAPPIRPAVIASLQTFGLGKPNFNVDGAFQSLKTRPPEEAIDGIKAIGVNATTQVKTIQTRLAIPEANGGPNEAERKRLNVELQIRSQIIQRCKEEFSKLRQSQAQAQQRLPVRPPATAQTAAAGTASPVAKPVAGAAPAAANAAAASSPARPPASAAAPSTPTTTAGSAGASTPASSLPKGLNVNSSQPSVPVPANLDHLRNAPSITQAQPYPAARGSRPTLNQGLANASPAVGTPGILKRPEIGTPNAVGSSSASASGTPAAAQTWEGLLNISSERNVASTSAAAGEDVLLGDEAGTSGSAAATNNNASSSTSAMLRPTGKLLEKRKIQELVGDIDPTEILEGDVEDLFLELADEFIENVTQMSCRLAKHRKGEKLEVKDVQLHLERNWNLRVPFPGSNPIAPPRIRGGAASAVNKT